MNLNYEFANGWKVIKEMNNMENAFEYSKEYIDFLNKSKTERLCAREIIRQASSQAFYNFMIQRGVCITPGTYFFDNIMDDRFFRINIANEKIEDIEKGITIIKNNLEEFITSYKNGEPIRSNKIFY